MVQTARIGRKLPRAPLRTSRPVYLLIMFALSGLLVWQIGVAVQRERHSRVVFVDTDGRRYE